MKKLIVGVTIIFIGSIFFTSCSSDSTVMSQFSKRKYMKNFKKSKFKQKEVIDEYQYADAAIETPTKTAKAENFIMEELIAVDNSEMVEFVSNKKTRNEVLVNNEEVKETDYSSWNSYNRNAEMAEVVSFHNSKSKNKNSKLNEKRVNDIVLIILAIFIPPLGVYLYEDTVTNNFWLDLILLLTVIGASIYALLVIFAGVSIN